jgi:hypothetical protein
LINCTEQVERIKASTLAKDERVPFRVIKRQFDHMKARYRGLAEKLRNSLAWSVNNSLAVRPIAAPRARAPSFSSGRVLR